MSANPIFFAPLRVPVTDPATGLMSRAWYLFFQALFDRSGGSTGPSNDDLEQLVNEDLDLSGVDQAGASQALADSQLSALDTLADPLPSDAVDALMLLMESQDSSTTGAANPTAKVGLTAVNGSASTFMRSDGSPPIDQTITPTWTGTHGFTGSPLSSTATRVETGLANFKSSSTTSVNNTLTADAAMTVTCNETGWYDFEALLLINETTAGTGGFQFDFAGGSATLANTRYGSTGISNGAAYANAARTTASLSSFNPVTTAATPDWSLCKGVIQVTVAGTFGLRWSQAATLAPDPTNLLVGSYIKLTKVG